MTRKQKRNLAIEAITALVADEINKEELNELIVTYRSDFGDEVSANWLSENFDQLVVLAEEVLDSLDLRLDESVLYGLK